MRRRRSAIARRSTGRGGVGRRRGPAEGRAERTLFQMQRVPAVRGGQGRLWPASEGGIVMMSSWTPLASAPQGCATWRVAPPIVRARLRTWIVGRDGGEDGGVRRHLPPPAGASARLRNRFGRSHVCALPHRCWPKMSGTVPLRRSESRRTIRDACRSSRPGQCVIRRTEAARRRMDQFESVPQPGALRHKKGVCGRTRRCLVDL
jgi:hypothetical protein